MKYKIVFDGNNYSRHWKLNVIKKHSGSANIIRAI